MSKEVLQLEGFQELAALMDEMANDIGPKDAKRVISSGIRKALAPVLQTAKSLLQENDTVDTGALLASLQIEARRATKKDKRSKYVENTDDFIGAVTTASGKKLATKKYYNLRADPINTELRKRGIKHFGIESDGRAAAIEFGTAKWMKGEGKPYLRPALESNAQKVVNSLGSEIRLALEKYHIRALRKASKGK